MEGFVSSVQVACVVPRAFVLFAVVCASLHGMGGGGQAIEKRPVLRKRWLLKVRLWLASSSCYYLHVAMVVEPLFLWSLQLFAAMCCQVEW